MGQRKCWEIKHDCLMRDRPRKNAGCPGYREDKSCWEVDWREVIRFLAASQQEYWYSHMDKCFSCAVYQIHPEEMRARVEEVKSFYLDD